MSTLEGLAMSLDNLDQWLTEDERDRETCEPHGYVVPCRICQLEHMEYQAECAREERG